MERWVAISGIVLTLTIGWVMRDAFRQEWTGYQTTYYRLALVRAANEAQREWAGSQRREVKQIISTEFDTVERCVTCHTATDNPAFRKGTEPLREHSDLLQSHPPQRFGCIVCHGGDGRAVTTIEAHGESGIRPEPLLRGEYLQAPCYDCHGETLAPQAISSVLRGKQLINRYMCVGCHQIEGTGGEEGPDLSSVGTQRSWLWLYAHLARPQAVTVGSTMPVFAMSRDRIRDIAIYLMTLGKTSPSPVPISARARSAESAQTTEGPEAENLDGREAAGPAAVTYDGPALFYGAGCAICHSVGRRGGQVGPALTHIGRKRNARDLKRLLGDPGQVTPDGKMPQLNLSKRQIEALTAYLTTLQ
ncbi:MAG: c-type cytochrome [Candidatus Binataceae bacterium]